MNYGNGNFQNFASSPRKNGYQVPQYSAEEAFRKLQQELNEEAQDYFKPIDKKTTKKWIEKAFDLAFEFNDDFSENNEVKQAKDEFLRNSRDWVARLYDEGDTADRDNSGEENQASNQEDGRGSSASDDPDPSISSNIGTKSKKKIVPPSSQTSPKFAVETPISENKSNEEVFRVAIDLPGVDQSDIDVTVEGNLLRITAKRNTGIEGSPIRKYADVFDLKENEVDTDQPDKLEANYQNGVLVISAPKQKAKDSVRKIPIT